LSDEQDKTAPIELPAQPAPPPAASPSESRASPELAQGVTEGRPLGSLPIVESAMAADSEAPPAMVPHPVSPGQRDVMFVPLAVSIGDGFKFGCGFFMAMVLAALVGFVVLALLFVVTSLLGLNLPITR
jgi:hypothetical protein